MGAKNSNMRERANFLGELVDYYLATWSPQALLELNQQATILTVPLECTEIADQTAIWGKQWFMRYHEFTRDPRVVNQMKCLYDASNPGCANNDLKTFDFNVDAFLYRATGNNTYLIRDMGAFYDSERIYYDNPTANPPERYQGYGPWVTADHAPWLQEAPYFLQALRDAGYAGPQRELDGSSVPIVYAARPETATNPGPYTPLAIPPRSWSNSSVIVLALAGSAPTFNVTLTPRTDLGPVYDSSVFVLPPPSPPIPTTSSYYTTNWLQPNGAQAFPPNYLATITLACSPASDNPCNTASSPAGLYRIETRSDVISRFYGPFTNLPEAMVWGVTDRVTDGDVNFQATGRQLYYLRVNAPDGQPLALRFAGGTGGTATS
jgi:hypothetical protein